MLDLDELQRLAEDSERRISAFGNAEREHASAVYTCAPTRVIAAKRRRVFEAYAELVAAMSPDTAKKLIAVARELVALRNKPVWEHIEAEADAERLRTALEELK